MPSEVTRFRLARAPQRVCTDVPKRPPLRLADWLQGSEFAARLDAEYPGVRRRLASEIAREREMPSVTSITGFEVPLATQLAKLDEWLRCRGNRPDLVETRAKVCQLFDRDRPAEGDEGVRPEGENGRPEARRFPNDDILRQTARLLAEQLISAGYAGAPPTTQRNLVRALLLLGMVELILFSRGIITGVEDILWAVRDRMLLLPDGFPVAYRSALARRPGFADLYVVRQEWNRYVAGEIAHVENVLPHEFRERLHTRTDETEVTLTTAVMRSREQELDVQSASRFELNEDARTDTALAVHVEGQVDTSGVYGPTKVDTHLGGSLDYSREESERHATQQATETVARAVNRIEETFREERATRTLTRIEERNTHRIDNNDGDAVVGMYRWLDKIVRLQTYRYPNRFLLEFEVPEPAAYLRWLEKRRGDRGFRTPVPVPFTLNGEPESDENSPLVATDISEDPADPGYYLRLAARWHVMGITPPPPAEVTVSGFLHVPAGDPGQDKTAHDLWIPPAEGAASGTGAAGGVEGEAIKIPAGYEAGDIWEGWLTTWDQDDSIRPAWNPGDQSHSFERVPPAAIITVGDSQNDPNEIDANVRNIALAWGHRGWASKPIGGQLNGRRTGTLPITILAANFGMMSAQVRVKCQRQIAGALLTWQLATYELLRAAYFELLRAHEEERAARSVQAGVEIDGRSPLENARVVREELKRQVIELLIGQRFSGLEALEFDQDQRPHIRIQDSLDHAPLIQFIEQVFEWENLTYVLYPYFWTDAGRWDLLQGIQSPDPDYARFLRAGSARVVLSARPGFARAVLYFMATGQLWTGGPAPIPGDPEYVSVADEIQAQTGAPDDGEPVGDSWEVRLPTTLVWLDQDPGLPKINELATLPDPPDLA